MNATRSSLGVARKYAMTKVARGDYLLPSNDARWLLRIASYEEDGSAEWGNGQKVVGTFWAVYRRPMPREGTPLDSILEWGDGWEFWAGTLATRKDALAEALRV
jgi:hypothetical protein